MDIEQLNHDVLRAYGISRRAGNGVLTKTYAKTIKTLEGHEQNEINCFVQLLTGCGFVNHARKLESLYKRMIDARKPIITEIWIAPWYMEPAALEETMKIWGFTLEEFQHFMIEFYPCWAEIYGQVEYDSIWPGLKEETFKGDALRAMIQRIYKIRWKEEMPPGLGQGDPADQTYYWLDKRGFEVCIPSS